MLLAGNPVPGGNLLVVDGVVDGVVNDLEPTHQSGPVLDLTGCAVLPAMIDLHMHGGGGHDVTTSPDSLRAAVAFHHAHGVGATLVSLVTAPVDTLCEQLSWIADATIEGVPAGTVLGAHLEGPFLSAARCGAQNPAHLIAPDRRVFSRLLEAARGTLRMMTIAPELPGALDLIDDAVAAGVLVAVGHTDAGYEQTLEAVDHGARVATHLFNGMPPIHHREPGPVVAALERGLVCELINDGVHLSAATARLAARLAPVALVTDAMDAAGAGDGTYSLGGQDVRVHGGQARLVRTDSLAGSTLTLDVAAGRALRDGWTPAAVAAATSGTQARLLDVADRFGSLTPGRSCDAVVLELGDGSLRGVLQAGVWQSV